MANPSEARNDCEQLPFCMNLGITTGNCLQGANMDKRCSQSEIAHIILLSKIWEQQIKIQKHFNT